MSLEIVIVSYLRLYVCVCYVLVCVYVCVMTVCVCVRYVTVCEALCRLLRKGRGSSSSVELVGVAALCRLLCNQLSSSDQLLWLYEEVRDLLHVQADNSCVDPTGRSACCLALAHLALLCQPQPEHVSQQLVQLLKLVGMRGVASALQATALHAWSVLIGALTPRTLKITVSR